MDSHHLEEIAHVNFVNLAALAVSFGEFESWMRVGLLMASLTWTLMKIYDWIRAQK